MKSSVHFPRRRVWQPLLWFVMLLALGFVSQHFGNRQQIAHSLARWLPDEAAHALKGVYGHGDPMLQFVQRTNRDLLYQLRDDHCEVQLQQLYGGEPGSWWPFRTLIPWREDGATHQALFSVRCETRWASLLIWSMLFTALITGMGRLLPAPLSVSRVNWLRRLLQDGDHWQQAWSNSRWVLQWPPAQQQMLSRLSEVWQLPLRSTLPALREAGFEHFDDCRLQWLQVGLQHSRGDLYQALQIARAEDGLLFNADHGALNLHGVSITLSSTPYCYYLWYASLRQRDPCGGWYVNPSIQRPDTTMAASVSELMEQCGGHRKAINELHQHGLRAKTLDQNRNKIKDELVAVLGEDLAADYLFESERDPHTGRSRYRLATPTVRIVGLSLSQTEKINQEESVT
ncbi:hypothetical protein [Pseudomaricurvus sp. HS19]|uniref:hypothetical protein n=1 Tax=Pseudomaricurvus sp. HS19 TaxID=2692626 RepID=UPI00136E361C|nr:hypothetical protein [Pseudomaricurvus sp. HS19]MYM63800.1 hypothetical protein [Pseudomaricurvus sp. HS19]